MDQSEVPALPGEPSAAVLDANGQSGGDAKDTPIAADAPALAPSDGPQNVSPAPTIELPRGHALTRWVPPFEHDYRVEPSTDETKPQSRMRHWQIPPIARLAAAIVLAVVGGAVAGSLGTFWVLRPAVPDQTAALNETERLKTALEHLNSELVGLRANIESSGRTASAQSTRLAERIDRIERGQAEPAARIAKITETLDRIDRRTRDLPDFVPPPPEPHVQAPIPIKEISRISVVPGWVVRSVYDGTALIQGRIGLIEVEVGDPLPGGGRVEAIRRQDGRWVVVTSKGLILAAQ